MLNLSAEGGDQEHLLCTSSGHLGEFFQDSSRQVAFPVCLLPGKIIQVIMELYIHCSAYIHHFQLFGLWLLFIFGLEKRSV